MSFFFFKQKTAYEMRISDWSSDVCSSDLLDRGEHVLDAVERPAVQADLAFVGVQERLDRRLAGSFAELRERRKDHRPRTLRYVRPQLPQRCGRMATFAAQHVDCRQHVRRAVEQRAVAVAKPHARGRKSTRLNSTHQCASR